MKYLVVAGVAAAVVLAFVGYRTLHNKVYQSESPSGVMAPAGGGSVSTPSASSSLPSVNIGGTGKYQVEILPLSPQSRDSNTPVMPSLDRPVVFLPSFPAEARKPMTDKINATVAVLKKNPQIFDEWMALAIFRKTIDDFEGARQIWEFLAAGDPKNPLPFANLANLYAFDLKDPVAAEKNFIKAMQKDPTDVILCRQASDFYRYVRKDDAKAKETLQKCISQTKSPDLQYLLDHYDNP